jgi:hypothetical protein
VNKRQDFVLFSDLDKLCGDNVSYCRNAVHITATRKAQARRRRVRIKDIDVSTLLHVTPTCSTPLLLCSFGDRELSS